MPENIPCDGSAGLYHTVVIRIARPWSSALLDRGVRIARAQGANNGTPRRLSSGTSSIPVRKPPI
jgi:hypothetical protein